MLIRYSRWDGSQSLPDFDADDVLAAMADDLVADGDPRRALERLRRRGFRTRDGERVPGLRELLDRLRSQRQALLRRHSLGDLLGDLRQRLDDVLRTERAGIDRRVEEARRQAAAGAGPDAEAHRAGLEALAAQRAPSSMGSLRSRRRRRGLRATSSWMPEAWQKFQELMMRLRQGWCRARSRASARPCRAWARTTRGPSARRSAT
jgi:hypothetical protein